MALKDDIVTLLRQDPVVSMINFQFKANPIRGSMFRAIGDRIASGKIRILKRYMDEEGEYDDRKNTMTFNPGFTLLNKLGNKATVIHECVHAIFDFQGLGRHDFAANEASAYIAESVFLMYHNSFAGTNFPTQNKIAARIAIDGDYYINDSDAVDLMKEIRMNASYIGREKYGSNDNW